MKSMGPVGETLLKSPVDFPSFLLMAKGTVRVTDARSLPPLPGDGRVSSTGIRGPRGLGFAAEPWEATEWLRAGMMSGWRWRRPLSLCG